MLDGWEEEKKEEGNLGNLIGEEFELDDGGDWLMEVIWNRWVVCGNVMFLWREIYE